MPEDSPSPDGTLVSVVVPTFKRPELLPRAVESVLGQTHQNWELIVSDDEESPGATAAYLAALSDPRIRVLRNPGPHGQCGNMNFALRHARGDWIKPLFDDDRLLPHCLEVFLRAVTAARGAGCDPVLASCGLIERRDGRIVREGTLDGPTLLLVPRRMAELFSLEGHPVAGGVPTQLFAHRRVVDHGIFFEQPAPLVSGVDMHWVIRARALGDNLIVNAALAEFFQGGHATVTSGITDASLDREFEFLIAMQHALMNDGAGAQRPLSYYQQVTRVLRAAHRLKNRRVAEALRLAVRCWRPSAWARAASIFRSRHGQRLVPRREHRVIDDASVRDVLPVPI